MKIVFATHEGVPLYGGGPEVKIHALRESLQALGITVELFDPWNAPTQLSSCDLVHLFGSNFAVYNLARNLHYQGVPFVVNPIFYSRHSPVVLRTVSGVDLITRRLIRGLWWEWGFTRDVCTWAKIVLPNTNAEAELLSKGFGIPSEKILVIANGVSLHFMDSSPDLFETTYNLHNFILYVGNIGPVRKNVLKLVRALTDIDHPAVLIGRQLKTGETDSVLSLIRQHPHIHLVEALPNRSEMLASAYAACAVFALPSQFETPGRAAMEAALAGARIVITPHGGTREYFSSYAEYVNPNSVADIRRAILHQLHASKNPALKTHISRHFSWDKLARETIDSYQNALKM